MNRSLSPLGHELALAGAITSCYVLQLSRFRDRFNFTFMLDVGMGYVSLYPYTLFESFLACRPYIPSQFYCFYYLYIVCSISSQALSDNLERVLVLEDDMRLCARFQREACEAPECGRGSHSWLGPHVREGGSEGGKEGRMDGGREGGREELVALLGEFSPAGFVFVSTDILYM